MRRLLTLSFLILPIFSAGASSAKELTLSPPAACGTYKIVGDIVYNEDGFNLVVFAGSQSETRLSFSKDIWPALSPYLGRHLSIRAELTSLPKNYRGKIAIAPEPISQEWIALSDHDPLAAKSGSGFQLLKSRACANK